MIFKAPYDLIDQHTGTTIPKGTAITVICKEDDLVKVTTIDRRKTVGRVKAKHLLPVQFNNCGPAESVERK